MGSPKTTRAERWAAVIIVILLLGVLGEVVPLVKQWTLPDYATLRKIESLFADQLAALRAVAEGEKNRDEVDELFSGNEILETYIVNSYGDGYGTAADSVKSAALETVGESVWFVADPALTRAVVNIWSDGKAVYERKFRVAGGEVKGCMLAI